MHLVLVATRAVLLPLDALGMRPLILRGEVIPVLTLVARQNDFFSRHLSILNRWSVVGFSVVGHHPPPITNHPPFSELAIGIDPMTSPLPRVFSTNLATLARSFLCSSH